MSNTYLYTNTDTFTFTQTEVVVSQFKIAIGYAGILDKSATNLLLDAISSQQISAIGIYAYNKGHKRVAEVEIEVDWEKNQQIIKTYGDRFENNLPGFNYNKGEAAETKILVNNLVKSANQAGLGLSMWVRTAKTITGDEREKLLERIGFNGGSPAPWNGEISEETVGTYQSIPQMNYKVKATDQY